MNVKNLYSQTNGPRQHPVNNETTASSFSLLPLTPSIKLLTPHVVNTCILSFKDRYSASLRGSPKIVSYFEIHTLPVQCASFPFALYTVLHRNIVLG